MKYKLHHEEVVAGADGGAYQLKRYAVPGGWLYESFQWSGTGTIALCFVPDFNMRIEAVLEPAGKENV